MAGSWCAQCATTPLASTGRDGVESDMDQIFRGTPPVVAKLSGGVSGDYDDPAMCGVFVYQLSHPHSFRRRGAPTPGWRQRVKRAASRQRARLTGGVATITRPVRAEGRQRPASSGSADGPWVRSVPKHWRGPDRGGRSGPAQSRLGQRNRGPAITGVTGGERAPCPNGPCGDTRLRVARTHGRALRGHLTLDRQDD